MDRVAHLVAPAALLSLAAVAAAGPVVTGLNGDTFARSGRIAVTGSGFGSEGTVLVAGLPALTSTWTDSRIVAYVPEVAPLGSVMLTVFAGGEQSGDVPLDVTDRRGDGRVRWTFETDSTNLWWRPALAPDGTIYVHTNNITDGVVYALAPDGALKWITKTNWFPYGPPSAGPDGAVYVGSICSISRIAPGGAVDWTVSYTCGDGIHTIPTVGPDGMLYGAYDAGLGAFSLDPGNGALIWSNIGQPLMFDWLGNLGNDVVFGRSAPGQPIDRFYVTQEGDADTYAFSLEGDQIFARGVGNGGTEPAIGSDGTVYLPANLSRWIAALDPEDGSTLWQWNSGISSECRGIELGPDDTLYFSIGRRLYALDPQTHAPIWGYDTGNLLDRVTLTPDATTLVTAGVPTYGQPGFVKAFDTASGDELWTVPLPGAPYPGFRVLGTHHPRISPDGRTAYVPTLTVADGSPPSDPKAYLYAIALSEETERPADLDGDGVVAFGDLLELLAAWGPCPGGCAGPCPADLNGDCAVGFDDLLALLADWG